jgi:hypothetical protein
MENEVRRLDLSDKVSKMGYALMDEGSANEDFTIAQAGTLLILISTLLLDEKDMFIVNELCAMFTAKQILDNTEDVSPLINDVFVKMLAEKKEALKNSSKKSKGSEEDPSPNKE